MGKKYTSRPEGKGKNRAAAAWDYVTKRYGEQPNSIVYKNDPYRGHSYWEVEIGSETIKVDSIDIP